MSGRSKRIIWLLRLLAWFLNSYAGFFSFRTFRAPTVKLRAINRDRLIKFLFQILSLLVFVDPCIIVQFTKKNPTRRNKVSKFYYSLFIWSSTCFGRHTAHHQEPTTAQAASGFAYVEGCRTCSCWTLSGSVQRPTTARPATFHVCKIRGCLCGFRLLVMGGLSPETCWASFKIGNNQILIHFCILLDFSL